MKKKIVKKTNGNVFRTIVKGVVKEEVVVLRKEVGKVVKRLDRVEKRLEHVEDRFDGVDQRFDQVEEKIETTFRQYRDDVLTKMDEVVGEYKTIREEQAAEAMLREEVEERVEDLESIHPHGQHPK